MITTTLQQASQIVEIQGVPLAAAKGSEGEFRASFVSANGGDSPAPKMTPGEWDLVGRRGAVEGELPSSKQALIAAAPKASDVATNHTTSTLFNLKDAVARKDAVDRKSTRLNSSHSIASRMPSSA